MQERTPFEQANPHSMTGFGRGSAVSNQMSVQVEIKTLNNKYLDIRAKLPRPLASWESNLRSSISKSFRRGSVEVLVAFQILDANLIQPVNEAAVRAYAKSIQEYADRMGIPSGLNLTALLRLPSALNLEEGANLGEGSRELVHALLDRALSQAIHDVLVMRSREGKALIASVERELATIARQEEIIRQRVPEANQRLRTRVLERIESVLKEARVDVDEARLVQELAFYADRADVTEELDRLRSHAEQMRMALANKNNFVVGKQLDFLVQELLRESNTIGSKTDDLAITSCVVELKLALDRVREQVQNIE